MRAKEFMNEMHTITGSDHTHALMKALKKSAADWIERGQEELEFGDIDRETFDHMVNSANKILQVHRILYEKGLHAGLDAAREMGIWDFIEDAAESIGLDVGSHMSESEEQFCENCGGSLAEAGKASRALCKSSRSNADLGASQLSSCKAQGLRGRESSKRHEVGGKRQSIKGMRIKGHKYGGPLPYNKSDLNK